jgi:hypothetical protein
MCSYSLMCRPCRHSAARRTQVPITVEMASKAQEMFLTGGSVPVAPVTHWNGHAVGAGVVGNGALLLRAMIFDDMAPPEDEAAVEASPHWHAVPYGILTGMYADMGMAV